MLTLYAQYTDWQIMDVLHPVLAVDMNDLTLQLDFDRRKILRHPERHVYRRLIVAHHHSGYPLATFFLVGLYTIGPKERHAGLWECIYIHDSLKGETQ